MVGCNPIASQKWRDSFRVEHNLKNLHVFARSYDRVVMSNCLPRRRPGPVSTVCHGLLRPGGPIMGRPSESVQLPSLSESARPSLSESVCLSASLSGSRSAGSPPGPPRCPPPREGAGAPSVCLSVCLSECLSVSWYVCPTRCLLVCLTIR